MAKDPLANPEKLVERVYAYVAYRLDNASDAQDVTSEVFERALRYRDSFDETRGEPLFWLLGIARRCVDDAFNRAKASVHQQLEDDTEREYVEESVVDRLTVAAAVATLDQRSRDLIALRFGADLSARQIGRILDMKTNAVEVALHRILKRLRTELEPSARRGPRVQDDAPPVIS